MAVQLEVRDGSAWVPVSTGVPGARVLAQVSTTAPTPRGTGDMWINPNEYMFRWDTGWKYPFLLNGWTNFATDGSHAVAKYRLVAGDVVCISGLVQSGSGVIFTLPPGYRPSKRLIFRATSANVIGRLDVLANGDVYASVFTSWFNIECSFYASA